MRAEETDRPSICFVTSQMPGSWKLNADLLCEGPNYFSSHLYPLTRCTLAGRWKLWAGSRIKHSSIGYEHTKCLHFFVQCLSLMVRLTFVFPLRILLRQWSCRYNYLLWKPWESFSNMHYFLLVISWDNDYIINMVCKVGEVTCLLWNVSSVKREVYPFFSQHLFFSGWFEIRDMRTCFANMIMVIPPKAVIQLLVLKPLQHLKLEV